MKLPSRWVTVFGLVVAIAAIFVDPSVTPLVSTVLGEHAATKLAAIGALIAAVGRALIPPTEPPAAP